MNEVMADYVARGEMPGIVTLVSRNGETHVNAMGTTAFRDGEPMRHDTIFRMASLTKPVIAAAAMTLVEECRLRLDDAVDRWLPELAERKVLRRMNALLDDTVPATRAITLRDLLTFRFGLGAVMVYPPRYPIQQAMEEAGLAPSAVVPPFTNDELMDRYRALPLVHQPGEAWLYSNGSDVLGVLLARCCGKSLPELLRERIFEPLEMKDTGFSVPEEKLHRLPVAYQKDHRTGEVQVFDEARGGRFATPPVFASGACGLVSTADDFFAFSQMMMNRGRHGNRRILSRLSVELMTTDQITPEQKARSHFFPGFWNSRGWGFGLAVVTRRETLASVPGRFGWNGGYGTSWYADPQENMTGILLTQRMWESPAGPEVYHDFWTAAYQAIGD
jgi:CubicO group peptidase (beta-lactamase class C family)